MAHTASAATNLLSNGGFETGAEGDNFATILGWDVYWGGEWGGQISSGGGPAAYAGSQCLRVNAFGAAAGDWEKGLGQSFPASAGQLYEADGWMMSPSGAAYFTPTNGLCIVRLEFFNAGGASLGGDNAEPEFRGNGPTNWARVTTGKVQAPAGTVTGRTYVLYWPGGDRTVDQYVYADELAVRTTVVDQAGALFNPGFEIRNGSGLILTNIPYWTGFGDAGAVVTNQAKSGNRSLKLYYPGNLAAQTWSATQGWKYATGAQVMTPSGADRLRGTSNLFAAVILQYLDASGTNVLLDYLSPSFKTNDSADAWRELEAVGVAPAGTAFGRTLIGLLGDTSNVGGAVYFDDATQRIVSTSGTVSGLLGNPGFDDGPKGEADALLRAGDLPGWRLAGGTNGSFIAGDQRQDGEQSMVLVYPNNALYQEWTAAPGQQYVAQGYLLTPSSAKFSTDGDSWGCIELSFYTNGGATPVPAYTKISAKFQGDRPADQWIYFAVTGTAPSAAAVTGRLTCAIQSIGPAGDSNLAGVIWFDQLTLAPSGSAPTNAWEQWQLSEFGTTTGPNTAPDEDYDGDGYPNWSEFIAGTQATNSDSVLKVSPVSSPGSAYVLRWPAASQRTYAVQRSTNLLVSAFGAVASNLPATPPQNSYTDAPPSGAVFYYRIVVSTNQP